MFDCYKKPVRRTRLPKGLFGGQVIDIPAVAIYLLFVFITTEVGKRWLKIPAIYLSWVIGAICYGVLAIANWFRMDSILYYLFLTLALNGVYKGATP